MSHYGISATHWNVNLGEIDEVQLHKVVQQGQGVFALSHGELAWCADIAGLIDGGHKVWVIVSDGRGKYRNTDRIGVKTKDGGRRCLYSRGQDGMPSSALADLPRYLRPDDPLPQSARELLARRRNSAPGEYPELTQRCDPFDVSEVPEVGHDDAIRR
jgi:hypothetical protein